MLLCYHSMQSTSFSSNGPSNSDPREIPRTRRNLMTEEAISAMMAVVLPFQRHSVCQIVGTASPS